MGGGIVGEAKVARDALASDGQSVVDARDDNARRRIINMYGNLPGKREPASRADGYKPAEVSADLSAADGEVGRRAARAGSTHHHQTVAQRGNDVAGGQVNDVGDAGEV